MSATLLGQHWVPMLTQCSFVCSDNDAPPVPFKALSQIDSTSGKHEPFCWPIIDRIVMKHATLAVLDRHLYVSHEKGSFHVVCQHWSNIDTTLAQH